jgi:hypothetical protein
MTTATKMPRLTDGVTFYNHDGLPQAAIVTGNRDSIDHDEAGRNGVPRIERDDTLHLTVLTPGGSIKIEHNVRPGTGPGQWSPLRG